MLVLKCDSVGPKGVSSGLSFRKLPKPSLDAIRKICEHYEAKCSGTYSSLASRYLYHMGQEIKTQVDALEKGVCGQKNAAMLSCKRRKENIVCECRSNIGGQHNYYTYGNAGDDGQTGLNCSEKLPSCENCKLPMQYHEVDHDENYVMRTKINQLERELLVAKQEAKDAHCRAAKNLKDYAEAFHNKAEHDRVQYEAKLREAGHEIRELKKDARLVINFVRRRANKELIEMNSKAERDKDEVQRSNMLFEERLFHDYTMDLKRLERKMKDESKNETKIHNKCERLKRRQEVEISKAKMETALEAAVAALGVAQKIEPMSNDAENIEGEISCCCYKGDNTKDSHSEQELLRRRVKDLEKCVASLLAALNKGAKRQ